MYVFTYAVSCALYVGWCVSAAVPVSSFKRGGIRFVRVGRFGATFYVSRGV